MSTVLEFTLAVAESSADAAVVQTAVGLIEAVVTDNVVVELNGFGPYGEWDQVRVLIRGYLPPDPTNAARLQELSQALMQAPAAELYGELHVQELSAESWADAWKQHYHPLRVGQTLLISPSWEEPEIRSGDHVIWLDPGMAFGTGAHPSTTLILELLERHLRPGSSMLDVGTGSGILAIAACKLGAATVLATDIDVQAVEVARENSQLNQVGERITVEAASVPKTGEYDLICANILADVIADLLLHEGLADRLTPDGVLLLSGIIAPRSHVVELALAARDLKVIDSLQSGDWLALAAARR